MAVCDKIKEIEAIRKNLQQENKALAEKKVEIIAKGRDLQRTLRRAGEEDRGVAASMDTAQRIADIEHEISVNNKLMTIGASKEELQIVKKNMEDGDAESGRKSKSFKNALNKADGNDDHEMNERAFGILRDIKNNGGLVADYVKVMQHESGTTNDYMTVLKAKEDIKEYVGLLAHGGDAKGYLMVKAQRGDLEEFGKILDKGGVAGVYLAARSSGTLPSYVNKLERDKDELARLASEEEIRIKAASVAAERAVKQQEVPKKKGFMGWLFGETPAPAPTALKY